MKLSRIAATIAVAAILSGCGITHHGTTATTQNPADAATAATATAPHLLAAAQPATTPAMTWLASAGGQAQVTLNDDIATLAAALEAENYSPTVANHLVFEADARTVRTEARTILATPALLPTTGTAAYKTMLNDFITVANLLQPGPGYGTTPQDDTAWNTALAASNITIS
jgi:PBP1b-binding outer membrane lipoprotein LpoB